MSRLNAAWERFWFAPESTSTLAVVRIAFGLVAIGWTLALLPTLGELFGPSGVLPSQPPSDRGEWGLLGVLDGEAAPLVVFAGLLLAAVGLTVGYHTRLAALLVFVGILAFERRNVFVFNSGDVLVRVIALYLALSPAGAALSVDRWRQARDRFWEFPARAPWALRLIQVQISILYLSTVWAKARGATWNDGTAVSYALRLDDLARFPVPDFVAQTLLVTNLLTYGTLLVELCLGVLVWNRVLRPWVLLAGVGLHLSIEYQLRVGFFSMAILAAYVAFVPSERMDALLAALRRRVEASRLRRPRWLGTRPATPARARAQSEDVHSAPS